MSFADQLNDVLPHDLPNRDLVIAKSSRHLDLIVETNRSFNLTRILDEREAAIKHVLDSVMPWRWFEGAREIVDVGSGAGFPGIPLSIVFPDILVNLVESTGKKSSFLEATSIELDLENVCVLPRRAEDALRGRAVSTITARAVAPLTKLVDLIGPAVRVGCRALLYKGPDVTTEIVDARPAMKRKVIHAEVVERYSLPDDFGARTLVELTSLVRK